MNKQRIEGKIIIVGLTKEGQKFRPSDWAERLSGNLCTFRNRRILYSPLLRPAIRDGVKCVMVDIQLKASHPSIFKEVMDFALKNQLEIQE